MLNIDEEFRDLIPRLSEEEYAGLRSSLLSEGCRDPLSVWAGTLLDGHNRYEICEAEEIEYDTKEIALPDRAAAKVWIIDNQLSRRNINLYQRGRLTLQKKGILAAEARKRQEEGWMKRGKKKAKTEDTDLDPNSDQDSQPRVLQQLESDSGVGHDTLHKISVIEARADEKTKGKLAKGEVSINKAYQGIMKKRNKISAGARKGRAVKKTDKPCGRCACCRKWKAIMAAQEDVTP